jgi:hypothetical protein
MVKKSLNKKKKRIPMFTYKKIMSNLKRNNIKFHNIATTRQPVRMPLPFLIESPMNYINPKKQDHHREDVALLEQ